MMLKATDIRRGMVITIDGVNFVVQDFAHHTPGNLRAMVQTKLRNMNNGALIDKRLRSVDQIEVPYVETKEYEYLYSAGDEHVFMDTETYDQLNFSPEIIGTAMDYYSRIRPERVGAPIRSHKPQPTKDIGSNHDHVRPAPRHRGILCRLHPRRRRQRRSFRYCAEDVVMYGPPGRLTDRPGRVGA